MIRFVSTVGLSILCLAACNPQPVSTEPKVFAPFPNAANDAFGCSFALAGNLGHTVFGTDVNDANQAFAYYGNETLRLVALETPRFGTQPVSAVYRAYDYSDFQLRLDVATTDTVLFSGTLVMLQRRGDDFLPIADPVAVDGICAG